MSIAALLTDEIEKLKQRIAALEANYRHLFDGMTSCMAVYEAADNGNDFIIKDFNRAAEVSSLISREEVIGKSIKQVFPGVVELGLFEVFQRVYRTGKPEVYPFSKYIDERITLWVENYVYKLPTGEIVAIYDDTTEKKQADEALKQRMEELEAINAMSRSVSMNISLDQVLDAALNQLVNTLSPDLVLIYLIEDQQNKNSQMRLKSVKQSDNILMFGKQQKDILCVGECLCGIAAQDKNPVFALNLNTDQRCTNSECKMAGIHSYAAIPLMNRDRLIGIVGIGSCDKRDFSVQSKFLQSLASIITISIANIMLHDQIVIHTEQLMNQAVYNAAQLRRHADQLESIVEQRTVELRKFFNAVESSPASIVITDIKGNIEYANPFFTELTGYTPDEVKGENPRILKSGIHPKEFYQQMWNTLLAGEIWRGEICNRKKNGELYWENVAISPLRGSKSAKDDKDKKPVQEEDNSGRIINFVGVKEDITERKNAQRIREDVDRILRHDLKSPLSAIIGFPQMMMDNDNLTDSQKKYLKYIMDSGQNMLDLIDLSLTIYQIETGKYKYTPSCFNLLKTLEQCVYSSSSICKSKDINIAISTSGIDMIKVETAELNGDRLLAFSIFSNLIKNAVEASPCNESVDIVIEPVPVSYQSIALYTQFNSSIRVTIHNKGAVPSQIRERFFDKYITYSKPNGTGLGTYSAKLLAQSQGWQIEMKTSEEFGTYLIVTIAPFKPVQ